MTGPYEIPAEMREFAEKSVQQARKAFDGFMGAVQKSTATAEETAANAGMGMKDASSKAVSYAQDNIAAAFDLAEKMVKAKDVQEVMALQAEYLKSQLEAVQEQAKELGETIKSAAQPKK
jgi:phasin